MAQTVNWSAIRAEALIREVYQRQNPAKLGEVLGHLPCLPEKGHALRFLLLSGGLEAVEASVTLGFGRNATGECSPRQVRRG